MKHSNVKDYFLLVLLALIWGASFSLIKVGVAEIGPISLAAGRILIAAAILLIWLRFICHRRLDLSFASLQHYFIIGLLGNSIPFSLIGWAELTLDSSMAAILMGIMPIFTLILAHYFLKDEPFSKNKIVGIGFGFMGLLVLLGFSVFQGTGAELTAQVAALAGSLCYAAVTIYVRLKVKGAGIEVATGAMMVAAIFTVLAALIFEAPLAINWSAQTALPMIILGVLPTAIASVLYFKLVRSMGASRFSQINYIIPLFGALIGVVFLNELLHWRMGAALVLVLIGVVMVHGSRQTKI